MEGVGSEGGAEGGERGEAAPCQGRVKAGREKYKSEQGETQRRKMEINWEAKQARKRGSSSQRA